MLRDKAKIRELENAIASHEWVAKDTDFPAPSPPSTTGDAAKLFAHGTAFEARQDDYWQTFVSKVKEDGFDQVPTGKWMNEDLLEKINKEEDKRAEEDEQAALEAQLWSYQGGNRHSSPSDMTANSPSSSRKRSYFGDEVESSHGQSPFKARRGSCASVSSGKSHVFVLRYIF